MKPPVVAPSAPLPHEAALLLVPTSQVADLQHTVSPSLSRAFKSPAPSQAFWLEGTEYSLIALPADRFEDFRMEVRGTSIEDDIKLIVAVGDTVDVVDLSAIEGDFDAQAGAAPEATIT